ncbi:MAG TPA: type I-C CRISPR-associated endonuclease Cas1c [Tepidisphaeraceae bacterium]|jgi:CRISPR-associated protein Cas1|nr:type I-C CRISPR-associated endonuclease Cas1c [Tepidisphaeraceae bacterium]
MKHHLNTLFITTQKSYLAKEGEALLVRLEKQIKLRVPIHTLGGVVCFGRVGISPALMGLCGERGVAITLLTESGKFLARVCGYTPGNVLLRREQYRRADEDKASAAIAAAMVSAKVANSRSVLLRALRDYPESSGAGAMQAAATRMGLGMADLQKPGLALDSVRGLEGEAANAYFGVFDHLITAQKEGFAFKGRSRRPPMDAANALLSFLYAMLGHDARAACEAAGLDPQVGFLHRDRPGRPGLALDLMEELRPYLADRLALSLINRKQVAAGGFTATESGGVSMDDATRKAVLIAYQKRKQEEVVHPFLGEKVTVGLIVHLQARLLARHLRGDLDAYPPFVWK